MSIVLQAFCPPNLVLFDHIQLTKGHRSYIPGSYAIFSLQHQTFLSLPGTSTAERPFSFGPTTSLALELLILVLRSSSVACGTPFNLRGSSSSVISFSLLFLLMGFSWQRYWRDIGFFYSRWIAFSWNSPICPVHLGCPCTV